ncbi:MAG: hypothetical protein KatS3mg028_1177 [Bacteroidia bacterium]|nr:MAG: hypothetical protein KatS3mg028_1177 [Bacteroidia bacterium]
MEEIRNMMTSFRQNPPQMLAGSPILKVKDYQSLTEKDLQRNQEQKLDFDEKSNVLQFFHCRWHKNFCSPFGVQNPKSSFILTSKQIFKKTLSKFRKLYKKKSKLSSKIWVFEVSCKRLK